MAQDFFESGMTYPLQIHPATGRFEGTSQEMNLKEWVDNILKNQKRIQTTKTEETWENGCELDSRDMEDIQNQIKNLASNFVPEWKFDTDNPDMGAALALIYANEMKENVNQFNGLMEHYRKELMNLSQVSPNRGRSSQTTVIMEPVMDLNEEKLIPKGTELLARAICHELDHLDGHLYVEKVEGDLVNVSDEDDYDDFDDFE